MSVATDPAAGQAGLRAAVLDGPEVRPDAIERARARLAEGPCPVEELAWSMAVAHRLLAAARPCRG